MSVRITPEYLRHLRELAAKGYVVEDGQYTKGITRCLRKACQNVYVGWDRQTKKVIIALPDHEKEFIRKALQKISI